MGPLPSASFVLHTLLGMRTFPLGYSSPSNFVSFFWSDDTLRSRSIAPAVLCGRVDIPAPPARLCLDWQRELHERLALAPGDVEPLPLARARMRWPDYRDFVQAVEDWLTPWALGEVLAQSEVALMACRGARYHHDGALYGEAAFCNLFLSEDQGLDVHFPMTGQRIALTRGTVMVFDTCQPHAVIPRGATRFSVEDFATGKDLTQVFLTWELPLERAAVASALQVRLDTEPTLASGLREAQVWMEGAVAALCPESGRWKHDV